MPPDVVRHDTVRRFLKRSLPVPLNRDELTDIAIAAAKKRQQVAKLEDDLAAEKRRRQQQIDDIQRDIDTADRELATSEQERIVSCDEIFLDGTIYTIRTDTWEAFEQRAATAAEAQRFLPAVEVTPQHATRPIRADAPHDGEMPDVDSHGVAHQDDEDDADEPDDGTRDADEVEQAKAAASAARSRRRAAKRDGAQ